jgi:hypothetical protein
MLPTAAAKSALFSTAPLTIFYSHCSAAANAQHTQWVLAVQHVSQLVDLALAYTTAAAAASRTLISCILARKAARVRCAPLHTAKPLAKKTSKLKGSIYPSVQLSPTVKQTC